MIEYNINPVLLNLGFVEIRYYGLVYVLGLLVAFFVLKHFVQKDKIKNLTLERLYDLMLYIVIGMLVGARAFYFLFYNLSSFISNPFEFFMVWNGGMSFHGSLVGIIVAVYLFCRKFKIRFYDIADLIVIPAALALFFGRIANFINGELIGITSNLPFCIKYQGVEDCRHPSQVYEALKNLLIFFVLWWLHAKKKLKSGMLFWLFVLMYGVLRFIVNFWRDDPRWLGVSMGQYLSIVMVVVAVVFIYKINKK